VQLFGSTKGVDTRFFSTIDGDIEYDNLFIFDEVGWNSSRPSCPPRSDWCSSTSRRRTPGPAPAELRP